MGGLTCYTIGSLGAGIIYKFSSAYLVSCNHQGALLVGIIVKVNLKVTHVIHLIRRN